MPPVSRKKSPFCWIRRLRCEAVQLRVWKISLADLQRKILSSGADTFGPVFLGCFFALIGLIIPSLSVLCDYGWYEGFGVAFGVHWALMKRSRQNLVCYSRWNDGIRSIKNEVSKG